MTFLPGLTAGDGAQLEYIITILIALELVVYEKEHRHVRERCFENCEVGCRHQLRFSHDCNSTCPCPQSLADRSRSQRLDGTQDGWGEPRRAFSCSRLSQGADGFPSLKLASDGGGST